MREPNLTSTGRSDSDITRGHLGAIVTSDRWVRLVVSLNLSGRERQIVECVLGGIDSEVQIAEQLGIPANTLHTHAQRLYRKLRVASRTQLLARVFVVYATLADAGGE